MNADNYWKQFAGSGKVEDYLAYSRAIRQENAVGECRQEGEHSYAGNDHSNRNDLKSDAYRGIR